MECNNDQCAEYTMVLRESGHHAGVDGRASTSPGMQITASSAAEGLQWYAAVWWPGDAENGDWPYLLALSACAAFDIGADAVTFGVTDVTRRD